MLCQSNRVDPVAYIGHWKKTIATKREGQHARQFCTLLRTHVPALTASPIRAYTKYIPTLHFTASPIRAYTKYIPTHDPIS
eukprot:4127272-Pyramimonas_sp.AAC.2